YESVTMERMLAHWTRLVESAVEDPDRRIADLEMLSPAEREQLLYKWNRTAAKYAETECIHQLFEAQASRRPDAVAVVLDAFSLSYGELERRANRIGRYLRSLGVGPEARVGLCLGRTMDMLVCLLGVLKAGGAYVPLDPAYPEERLRYMEEDAGLRVLLTRR